MNRNVLLTIAYDGTEFSGWQRQPGVKTVQGELERALSVICREPVTIDGTSRTDAGVHALGQRATLRGSFAIPAERIPRAVNGLLSGEGLHAVGAIRVLEAVEMPEGFHARFDSKGKTYRYAIRTGSAPNLFERNYAYYLEKTLDVSAMEKASRYLIGTHDFKSFQAAGGNEVPDTVRTIWDVRWLPDDTKSPGESNAPAGSHTSGENAALTGNSNLPQKLAFEVSGNGFLYHMVRNIVGTLVEVGQGKLPPEAIPAIIEAKDRTKAGHTAPAAGLFLKEIYYEDHEIQNVYERKE